jgi:hypothetical protein
LFEALSFTSVDIVVTLDELKEQLKKYEEIKNKTEFQ